MRHRLMFLLVIVALKVCAQESPDSSAVMRQILQRLDSLEKENRELAQDVRSLRQELAASRSSNAPAVTAETTKPEQPSLDERISVEEQRTAEQAQTKVEAAHKFPIQLNGMLLFNAFANSAGSVPEYSGNYSLLTGPNRAGATLRQTLLGLDFQGPHLPGNGRVNGSLTMDFSNGASDPEYIRLRLRRADISFDWENRSFSIGQDKPLISPYQPDSLAEVGIPPLAGAGNLWLWLPQARYEERLHLGTNSGIKAQLSVMQTQETYATIPYSLQNTLEPARPALEGRFAFWHKIDDTRRFEFAPGFHVSTTHVAGASVGSHIGSFDWLIVPSSHFQLSGTVFRGQNVAGLGALGNGFTITPDGEVRPVNSMGGWAQVAFPITSRLTVNAFSGVENDHSPFLAASDIVHNWTYAANAMYHFGPNIVVSLEALQMRTRSLAGVPGLQNHYDLAFGYLF
jgi:hypothetical protein